MVISFHPCGFLGCFFEGIYLYVYLEAYNDLCFEWSLDLVLEGFWGYKIEEIDDKQIPGILPTMK